MQTYTSERYSTMTIALHWLMLVLMIAVYACIELREFFPKGSDPREALKMWHFMLGLTVLALVLLRVAGRLGNPTPAIVPPLAPWQQALAKLVHGLLYAMMIGLPIAGWLLLSAAGKPIPFFGLELPALTGENKALAKQIKELHSEVGEWGYFIIGIHALAAIYHHHILKDNTLTRMLPPKG